MRNSAIAVLVLLSAVTAGATRASAAPISVIGQFSWDDPGLGTGPLFTFEYFSRDLLPNLSVDLDTDLGRASFGFDTSVGFDNDGDGIEDAFRSQTTEDLSLYTIFNAFIRSDGAVLFLLDPNVVEATPLLDVNGDPLGLDGVNLFSAQVGISAPAPPPPPPNPVPEPGTLLLLSLGAAGGLAGSRRLQSRR